MAGLTAVCIDNDERILSGMQALLTGWGCSVMSMKFNGGCFLWHL